MLKNFFLKKTFLRNRLSILKSKVKLYQSITDETSINKFQLKQFNELWRQYSVYHPFYKYWKKKYALPDEISSLIELKNFPVLNKDIINEHKDLIFSSIPENWHTYSGGSSGSTTKFPISPSDFDYMYALTYLGRSWNNYYPLDKTQMFWGHSHLFGSGKQYYINKFKRKLQDSLINTKRVSAYDLGAENIGGFIKELNSFKPKVIISYASSLFKIAKFILENHLSSVVFSPELIVLTSETTTKNDVEIINKVFHSKIILEYGMAETGVISYSYGTTFFNRVYWDSFVLQANSRDELFLTTIHDRLFPLINYFPNDRIVKPEITDADTILSFENIIGKSREMVRVKNINGVETEISIILFDHILKYYPGIYSTHYQVQESENILIQFTSDRKVDIGCLKNYFDNKIRAEIKYINTSKISFRQVQHEPQTFAGKSKKIICD